MGRLMTTPIVVIVNGFPQSGKDMFCNFAMNRFECINYSSVDTVKSIAHIMGWDGIKTPRSRNMLSALKTFTTEWFDLAYKEMVNILTEPNTRDLDFVFFHIREPEEISRIEEWCIDHKQSVYTVFIRRNVNDLDTISNRSDMMVENMIYDSYISNNGTIRDFEILSHNWFNSVMFGKVDKWVSWT